MAQLDNDVRFPHFTLRKHVSPITSLEFLKVPISTRTRVIASKADSKSNLTLKPFLVSVDSSGKVFIWDLVTHRPITEFQAHNSQIMTVKQLGIDQDGRVDHNYFGLMITHGGDHCIKFWRVFDKRGLFDVEKVYELPVNTLNFSNVDVMGKYLVTPNTISSNTFDVYDIEFMSEEKNVDETRLKRVFKSVDVYDMATKVQKMDFKVFGIERSNDDVNRLDKFGIIMKLLWVSESMIFIGFESGHVASVSLDFSAKKFKVESISANHFPDPVLSLWKDSMNQLVLSASVRSEISIHFISIERSTSITLEKFGKISSIASLNDRYVFSSWNGYIKFYRLNRETLELCYESSFKKSKGLIQGDLNVVGNVQGDPNDFKGNRIVKPNALNITKAATLDSTICKLMNKRDMKVLSKNFLAIGYSDGTVMIYNDF